MIIIDEHTHAAICSLLESQKKLPIVYGAQMQAATDIHTRPNTNNTERKQERRTQKIGRGKKCAGNLYECLCVCVREQRKNRFVSWMN